jgi:hypothetical protein
MGNRNSKPPGRPKGTPKTGGRAKGTPNKATVEVKEAARLLVDDPEYRKTLKERLLAGTAGPGVETMLWHYAYGKPKESVELTGKDGETLPGVVVYLPDNGRDKR